MAQACQSQHWNGMDVGLNWRAEYKGNSPWPTTAPVFPYSAAPWLAQEAAEAGKLNRELSRRLMQRIA